MTTIEIRRDAAARVAKALEFPDAASVAPHTRRRCNNGWIYSPARANGVTFWLPLGFEGQHGTGVYHSGIADRVYNPDADPPCIADHGELERRCLAEAQAAATQTTPPQTCKRCGGSGRHVVELLGSPAKVIACGCQREPTNAELRERFFGDETGTYTELSKRTYPTWPEPMKPQETTMTPKEQIVSTLKTDATDAAWRTAGSQFVKLARDPLVGLLQRHLGPEDEALRGRIAQFLETEIGTAILASLLSMGLTAIPNTAGEVPQRLARELRVRAMADAGDVVADVLMGPLRQVVAMYLQDPQSIGVTPALGEPTPETVATTRQRAEVG